MIHWFRLLANHNVSLANAQLVRQWRSGNDGGYKGYDSSGEGLYFHMRKRNDFTHLPQFKKDIWNNWPHRFVLDGKHVFAKRANNSWYDYISSLDYP